MAEYTQFGVTLSENQIRKIKSAHDNNRDVTIRISKQNLSGNMNLPLTQTQIKKIKNSKSGIQLCLSKSQLKYKNGGFLPLLLAAIPAMIGAAGGVAGGIASAINSSKQTSEMTRHNKSIEDITKQQLGSGIISDAVAPLSEALKKLGFGECCVKNLKGCTCGNGLNSLLLLLLLYLEREGSGLFLARQGE